jgi:peptide/nickel transport system ATP-binding protein
MTTPTPSTPTPSTPTPPTLAIRDLTITSDDGLASQSTGASAATTLLHISSLDIAPGERVGLIGESGSGKTLTALAVMGLLADGLTARGSIHLSGLPVDVIGASERSLSAARGSRVSMVFQEPMTALNPLMTVGAQIAEVMLQHHSQPNRAAAARATQALLARVELPSPLTTARSYPHQLSGGQRQRVVLAMALANTPALLLCDEPTTALDVTVQAQMIALIDELVTESATSLLFVTHDLAVAASLCDRIVVLRDGVVVEEGPTAQVLGNPAHGYTRALVAASDVSAGRVAAHTRPAVVPGPHSQLGDARPVFNSVVATTPALIEARDLERLYSGVRRSLFAAPSPRRGLRPVSFDVRAGEAIGIVGESGSGKSTLVRLLAGLDRPTAGSISIAGVNLATATRQQRRNVRSTSAMVFQDPASSLDPRMTVAQIIAEPLLGISRGEAEHRAEAMLASVRLSPDALRRYPHQFSGGQRQRISIARALITKPQLLIADEPVSALDVSVRARVLELLDDLVEEYQLTLVLVSHDLAVVRRVCDTVLVMRDGVIVESGPTDQVYSDAQHSYTRALVSATPTLQGALARVRRAAPGQVRSAATS